MVLPLAGTSAAATPPPPRDSATGSRTASAGTRPTPGAPGVGDRLFPDLGNGGYDALHYDLALRYATTAPGQGIVGTVTIRARATQALSAFDLDFAGRSVGTVTVDGVPARHSRHREELVITPRRPLRDGATFTVEVAGFTARPTRPRGTDPSVAFFTNTDGSATAGQPDAMHRLYPSNDTPDDKATFSFALDVPHGETAVANGALTGEHQHGSRTTSTYSVRRPMATELTQIVVGAFTVIDRGRVGGVLVRDVVPTRLLPVYRSLLAIEKSQLPWLEHRLGAYPFDRYGTLVVQAPLGFALETQTLSLFDTSWFTNYPKAVWAPAMLHELTHQWFGDSVSPVVWSDVWLNEGHATWYEDNWAAQHGDLATEYGVHDVTSLMQRVYALGDRYRAQDGPVAHPVDATQVFNPNVYAGGELVLYALRQKIGVAAFERVERAWLHAHEGGSASTADFIALASRVSHRPLTHFLRSWLYGRTTPPMPGHPGWTVDPVTAQAPTSELTAPGLGAVPRT